jgi:hypothetical protein
MSVEFALRMVATAGKAMRALLNAYDSAEYTGLVLGTKPDARDPLLLQMQVSDDAAERFSRGLKNTLKKYAKYEDDDLFELRKYEPRVRPEDHQMLVLRASDYSDLAATLNMLLAPANLPLASEEDEVPWRSVQLQARVFTLRGQPIVLLRKATAATLLKRRNKVALIWRDGVLDVMEEEGVLLDEAVDAIYWSGHLYLMRPSAIETLFRFYEDLQEAAEEIVDSLSEAIPIMGLDDLKAAAGTHYQMLRKIHHISQQPYLAEITMDDVERVVKKWNLPIIIEGKGKQRKIVYDKSDKWAILRLLDDDYLRSELTARIYEVKDSSKHVLNDE